MFKKLLATSIVALSVFNINVGAVEVPVVGNVASKCVVTTDTAGVYGNPLPNKLSTAAVDGGVQPVIRFDVIQSEYYKAVITFPNTFSSSPTLNDVVAWNGEVSVARVTDSLMSAYDANKRTYDNTTEFDLTVAGTVWFKVSSTALYGYEKAFPAGTYRAVINADCIAL